MVYFMSCNNGDAYSYPYRALDGDVNQIRPADMTPDAGARIREGYAYVGRAYEPQHVPGKIELSGPRRPIRDVYDAFALLVDQKFKAAVEKLEPGLHQFFPVDLLWQDGSHAADRYWFVPCTRLDSVDREKTTFEFRGLWDLLGGPEKRLVFSRAEIGDHHVWIDKFIHVPTPIISDALKAELEAAGVTGLDFKGFEAA